MDNLDDIKYAVKDVEIEEIIALFENEVDARACADSADDYVMLDRDENDFYIDISVETSSRFDVRG